MAAAAYKPVANMVGPYGLPVPANLFETLTVTLQGQKGAMCGIRVNAGLVVLRVERNSISEGCLQFADVITAFNGVALENKNMFVELLKKHIVNAAESRFKVELKILRPVCLFPMDPARMPSNVEALPGAKYRIGLIHMIHGCKLSLQIKSVNNKVYVTKLVDDSLASMALQVGDVILDVDKQPVGSVKDASDILFKSLKEKGYATMVLESPDDSQTKQLVRSALLTEKTQEIDLLLPTDAAEICKAELARFIANPEKQPSKLIYREPKKPPRPPTTSRLKLSEQVEYAPIACENNPNLLVKVFSAQPGAPNYQPLNALNSSDSNKK